jgi:hypothetical protein
MAHRSRPHQLQDQLEQTLGLSGGDGVVEGDSRVRQRNDGSGD